MEERRRPAREAGEGSREPEGETLVEKEASKGERERLRLPRSLEHRVEEGVPGRGR